MITSLPDPEIQRAEAERKRLEPRNRFQFLWDSFFKSRKFKLTGEEVGELTAIERNLERWTTAARRIWNARNDLQGTFDAYVSKYLNDPTEENYVGLMAHTYDTGTFQQLSRAADQIEAYLAGERSRLFPPIVSKHLTRIHDSLCAEYVQQEAADRKSLERLKDIASGGESQACIEIRVQVERIKGLLDGGDLSNWREALGPFL